ncbi:hypothetical protein BLNAU_9214 [Blattamonas nauphoetae]|uniref:Uncharacterized protein n=1 Tax=Blattamonas nauphoetae TaxID=2049346 RepID=A0ABQ9XWK7_9EUKA|nr:hypothetical protein BLNAU_9214 [Blattamonas nauphoetae]
MTDWMDMELKFKCEKTMNRLFHQMMKILLLRKNRVRKNHPSMSQLSSLPPPLRPSILASFQSCLCRSMSQKTRMVVQKPLFYGETVTSHRRKTNSGSGAHLHRPLTMPPDRGQGC